MWEHVHERYSMWGANLPHVRRSKVIEISIFGRAQAVALVGESDDVFMTDMPPVLLW